MNARKYVEIINFDTMNVNHERIPTNQFIIPIAENCKICMSKLVFLCIIYVISSIKSGNSSEFLLTLNFRTTNNIKNNTKDKQKKQRQ